MKLANQFSIKIKKRKITSSNDRVQRRGLPHPLERLVSCSARMRDHGQDSRVHISGTYWNFKPLGDTNVSKHEINAALTRMGNNPRGASR